MSDENTQILLAGDIYFDRNDGTASSGLIGPVNTEALTVTQEVEERVQESRMKETFGQARAAVNIPSPPVIKIVFRDQPSEVLAMALMGDVATLSEGSATVTDEPVTAKLGRWVDLPNRNLTSGTVVVTNVGATTTYVEGTDYEINYATGMLRALAAGSISDAEALLVDYDSAAVSGSRIQGTTRPQSQVRIVLDGKNLVTGKPVQFEAYQAVLRPDGEVDLNSGEFITTSLSGNLVTPVGKTAPFVLDEFA